MMNLKQLHRCTRVVTTLMLCLTSVKAVADPTTTSEYVVTATVLVGTCTVDVSSSSSMPSVDLARLAKGGLYSVIPVDVDLSCGGIGDGKMPTLHVKGTPVDIQDNQDGDYLFADKSSDLNPLDVGFVLSKTNGITWDESQLLKNDSDMALGLQGSTYTGGKLQLYAGVGCGSNASCQDSAGKHPDDSGTLNASIKFTFSYK